MRFAEVAVKSYKALFALQPESLFILDTDVNPRGTSGVWHSAVPDTGLYSIPTAS